MDQLEMKKLAVKNQSQFTEKELNFIKTQFEKIEILAPTYEKRAIINNILRPFFENIRINAHENIRLKEIRDTLLPKLLSGEISINQATK